MDKRLLIDMDGVLSDVYTQFLKYEFEDTGLVQKKEELYGKLEAEAFKHHDKYVEARGFFRTAPVIEGSVDALKKLNEAYELYIVSAATVFPKSLEEKHDWLKEHFPFIDHKQMVFCGTKTIIKGDIMIDDHFKNLDHFEGKTILFTQPHNFGKEHIKHIRVNNWSEILTILA